MNIKGLLFGSAKAQVKQLGVYKNSTQEWLPISAITDDIIVTKDGRYVKIIEILPVNFYLKSYMEQQSIIMSFAQYLKIAPDNLQICVRTQKADINAYEKRMWEYYDKEQNERCKEMIADNIDMVRYLAVNEAVTHRFFIVIQLEEGMKTRSNKIADISARLYEEAQNARKYLDFCGLESIEWGNPDAAVIGLLYDILNKGSAASSTYSSSLSEMPAEVYECEGSLEE